MRNLIYWAVILYLRFWAKIALDLHKPEVIGITGSVGKSSEREVIYSMIKNYYPSEMIEKGNSEIGIPLGILGLDVGNNGVSNWIKNLFLSPFGIFYLSSTKYLVIEMGVDEPLPPKNMGYLLRIVKPDIAVFLNVYTVHSLQFGQYLKTNNKNLILEAIAKEKGRIITDSECSVGILNSKLLIYNQFLNLKNKKTKLFIFGNNQQSDLVYKSYEVNIQGTKFAFENKEKEKIEINIQNYVLPKEYEEVFGAALVLGKSIGLTNKQIKVGIEKNFRLPPGRSTLFEGMKNTVIIDSSYNASKKPVIAFLEMAYELKKKTGKNLVFIFGDMRELGNLAKEEHEEVAKKITEGVDYLYCVGEMTKKYIIKKLQITNYKLQELKHFQNSVEAGKYLRENLPENSLVLVKGSQNTIFLEEAIKFILKNKEDKEKLCRQEGMWKKKKAVA